MSTIIVSGGGVHAPTECFHGKCMFACSAAYRTGLICIAKNRYVEPGPVPKDCPVAEIDEELLRDYLSKFLKFPASYMYGDDGK